MIIKRYYGRMAIKTSISRDLEETGMFQVMNQSISNQHLHSCTYTMILDLPRLITISHKPRTSRTFPSEPLPRH